MTSTSPITIPRSAVKMMADEIRVFGGRRQETGGFLMSHTGTTSVSVVAFAGSAGITRNRGLFQITQKALAQLFIYADDNGLQVPAQFHSHRTTAFLSRTDAEEGLRVEGFTSIVIPAFTDPPSDPNNWGWWQFSNGNWTSTPPAAAGPGDILTIRFDEDGIHAR